MYVNLCFRRKKKLNTFAREKCYLEHEHNDISMLSFKGSLRPRPPFKKNYLSINKL